MMGIAMIYQKYEIEHQTDCNRPLNTYVRNMSANKCKDKVHFYFTEMSTLKISVFLKYAVKSINKKVKSFIIQNYASLAFILNI